MSMFSSSSAYVTETNMLYQKQEGSDLFLLKECLYKVQIEELLKYERHEVIGKDGNYGISYKYITKQGPIVIKRLVKLKTNSAEEDRAFQQRMEEIGSIGDHPNVDLPFGYYCSPADKFLLYGYAAAGTLRTLLDKSKAVRGTGSYWQKRIDILIGASRGLAHIHSKVDIIHGNIKSSNVIVTQDKTGCITDFGFAPIMDTPSDAPLLRKLGIIAIPGPPELKETKEATQHTDVYHIGVMLLDAVPSFDITLVWHPLVQAEMKEIARIGGDCCNQDPNRRPKMDEVARMIQNAKKDWFGKG